MVIGNVAELRETGRETKVPTDTARARGALVPGRRGQGDDQSLQQPSDVGKGILAGEEVEEEWQQDQAVHEQARQDRDEVHAQLLAQVCWIMHV